MLKLNFFYLTRVVKVRISQKLSSAKINILNSYVMNVYHVSLYLILLKLSDVYVAYIIESMLGIYNEYATSIGNTFHSENAICCVKCRESLSLELLLFIYDTT